MAKKKNTVLRNIDAAEKSGSKSQPATDVYFNKPHWLRVWHNHLLQGPWLRGFILALILVALALGTMILGDRLFEPPSIVKYLPADATVAYIEFDLDQYDAALTLAPLAFPWNPMALHERLSVYLPEPSTLLPHWVGNKVGLAWILNPETEQLETWVFLEMEEVPIKTLPEGKTIGDVQNDPNYEQYANGVFFEGDPDYEWYAGDYLVMGPDDPESIEDPLLWKVMTGEVPNLKKDPNYLQLRPTLPYEATAFFYMSPALAWDTLLSWVPLEGWRADIVETLLPMSPAMGMVLQAHEQGIAVQTHWLGDKTLLGGEAFFHMDEKYRGRLLSWLPSTTVRFTGGQSLAPWIEQGFTLLAVFDPSKAAIYEALLLKNATSYVSESFDIKSAFKTFFEQEYALAWLQGNPILCGDRDWGELCGTPEMHPVLFVELTSDSVAILERLVEALLAHGVVETDLSAGTVSHSALTLEVEEENGMKFNLLVQEDGTPLVYYLVVEDQVLIVTRQRDEIKTMIDTLLGNEETYSFSAEEGVSFGDHVSLISLEGAWGEAPWGIIQIFSSFNFFDDGMSTWHEIQFE